VDYLKHRRSWTWSAWIRPSALTTTTPAAVYSEGNDGIIGLIGEYQGGIIVSVWSEDLTGWTDHGDVIVGTGETYSTFASAKDKTHRYWRLVFAP